MATLFVALAVSCPALLQASGVTVTYLANEGFLLASGEEKVLIDALFPGIDNYPTVPATVRADLVAARGPFAGVDLVLATHYHDDHFGPEEVLAFLTTQRDAPLVSTPQAVERIRASGEIDPELQSRLHAVHPREGDSVTFTEGAVRVEILNLHHGRGRRPPVENLGFLIELGGLRILHVGDTEVSLADVAPYDLDERAIDLALLPGWFLAEPGWAEVTRALAPRAIVAMHLAEPDAPASWFGSAGSLEGRKRRIREAFPGVWIPSRPLESRQFDPPPVGH